MNQTIPIYLFDKWDYKTWKSDLS